MRTSFFLALAWLSFCLPAGAAAPADGRATAASEAELRAEGAELVEIEGFTGPDGDIPCKGNSFSNAWHYKFYVPASGEWLIVNACGDKFINAAKHLPYMKSGEPDKKLPYTLAAPAAVLKKLAADEIFRAEPNQFSRDVRLQVRMLPAKDGRPAGCYWSVSQGKARALADCEGRQAWKVTAGSGKPKAAAGTLQPAVKGKDTAGRYASLAVDYMSKKVPGSRLISIATLADKTGSSVCVGPSDGWSFYFSSPSMGVSIFGGCKGKTSFNLVDFDKSSPVDLKNMDPLILPFKDSDFALAQVPKDCLAKYRGISMNLSNYKAGHSPAAGRNQVWTVQCGSKKYYIDAGTGQPVPVEVPPAK